MRLNFVSVVFGMLLSTQAYAFTETPIILDAELKAVVNKSAEMNSTERTALEFASGAKVTNCVDYIKMSALESLAETDYNFAVHSEYLVCDMVHAVKNSRAINIHDDHQEARTTALATRLNLASFPSSLGPRIVGDTATFADMFKGQAQVSGNSVIVDADDWYYRLSLLAIVEVNDNGQEDWLIGLTDKAKQGTYNSYEAMIVLDVGRSGLLQAQKYQPAVHAITKEK